MRKKPCHSFWPWLCNPAYYSSLLEKHQISWKHRPHLISGGKRMFKWNIFTFVCFSGSTRSPSSCIYIITVILILIIIIIITSDWQVAMTWDGGGAWHWWLAGSNSYLHQIVCNNSCQLMKSTISVSDIYRRSIIVNILAIYWWNLLYLSVTFVVDQSSILVSLRWGKTRKKSSSCLRGRDLWIILWYFANNCR